MNEEWFRDWSYATCEFQGFQPGTGEFEECREKQVSKVLASPILSDVVRPAATVQAAAARFRGASRRNR